MDVVFVIEDELHAELHGEFSSFEAALEELKFRSGVPWDQAPNVAPCSSWKNCGREYVIVTYDKDQTPWDALQRVPILEISASGVQWLGDFQP